MFKRRLIILLALIGLIFLVILVRLGQLQLFRGEQYRREAELGLRQYEFPQGQRGRILDRNGVILAEDLACHNFCMDYGMLTDEPLWRKRQIRAIAKEMNLNLGRSEDEAKARKEFEQRKAFTWELARQVARAHDQDLTEATEYVTRKVSLWRERAGGEVREQWIPHPVVRGLGEKAVNSLRPLMKRTVGAELIPGHYRRYPQGPTACHIIGTIGPVFKEDVAGNLSADKAGYVDRMRFNLLPGDTVGKTGVEKMCEAILRPRRGVRQYRLPGEVQLEIPAQDGRDVHLTIDIALQAELTRLLQESGHNGAIVIIDVPNGDVLAMASWPTYDLNRYRTNFNELVGTEKDPNDPSRLSKASMRARVDRPLIHRAVAGVFEPGSTVKPFTALAGLGAGKIKPNTTFVCEGTNPFARNGKPRCWIYKPEKNQFGTHGPLNLFEAIKHSCNIYFVNTAQKLGPQALVDWFGVFGLTEKPGTGLPEESGGLLPRRALIPSDAWFMAIGQGFAATPLQVACAHAMIARGGVWLSPRLSLENAPPQVRRVLGIAPDDLQTIRRGMHAVVHEPGGTANKIWMQGEPLGVEICGKTGTATPPKLMIDTDGDGRPDVVKDEDHAWFAGFAPYKDPQVAFVVVLEYAGSGGKMAGPVAKEALRLCQQRGYLRGGRAEHAGD